MLKSINKLALALGAIALIGAAAGATITVTSLVRGSQQQVKDIRIDGSSTVFPITKAIADVYQQHAKKPVQVSVEFSGTGGGFKKFCTGETDINDASRPIKQEEMDTCRENGIAYIEMPVAFDALTIAVNPQNTWVESIKLDELKKMWSSESQQKITQWKDIRTDWPYQPFKLVGPGSDSGTYDYFIEALEMDYSRSDYISSEDDDILVQEVSQNPNALGYFGFAYYEANKDKLRAIPVDSGSGPVEPSLENVTKSRYQPLSRPLFIYVNALSAQRNPAIRKFVDTYMEHGAHISSEVGYIPLPPEGYRLSSIRFENGKVGTLFGGQAVTDLSIRELLKKQATF